jgi:hypothetical protein
VNEKKDAIFIVPHDMTEISTSALKLCELFVAKVFDSSDSVIDVKVDANSLLVISGSQPIKELISMYLKAGKLPSFYRQLFALARKDAASGESVLRIVLRNKMYFIVVHELNGLPNLHMRVSKFEVTDSKW